MKPVEPVPVIVAKAKVKGVAEIELQQLGEIVVKAKQPVHVKYLYRLEELSKDKENWRFQLASAIGTQKPAPTTANWEDRWGRNDSLWGVLQQEFIFERPGNYDGSFQVDAKYSESEWGSKTVKKQNEKTAQGRFKIKVV
jgi:hypothetical protein